MTDPTNFAKIWGQELEKMPPNQPRLTPHAHDQLTALRLTEAQFTWAVRYYQGTTLYATVPDFLEVLDGIGDQLPSDAGARAAISDSSWLQRLGEELEELHGAWFPTQETTRRIAELEARIVEAT